MNILNLNKDQTKQLALLLAFTAVVILFRVNAGTGGTEFDDVWDKLTEWTQGTLGRIVAGAMIFVGVVGGIVRQSLMAFAIGIGGGIGLYNTPTIINSIMTTTVTEALPVAAQISNGLGG